MAPTTKRFRQAFWDEPLLSDMGRKGRLGFIVPTDPKIDQWAKGKELVPKTMLRGAGPPLPDWLDRISTEPPEGRVSRLPSVQDVGLPVTPQLIIELLSR